MPEKIIYRYLGSLVDGSKFQATFSEGPPKPLEFLALVIERVQPMVDDPVTGPRNLGPEIQRSEFVGVNLKDNDWQNVNDLPNFTGIEHRPT